MSKHVHRCASFSTFCIDNLLQQKYSSNIFLHQFHTIIIAHNIGWAVCSSCVHTVDHHGDVKIGSQNDIACSKLGQNKSSQ